MIEGVDTSRIDPSVDDGAARDTREKLCTRRTLCVLPEHDDKTSCVEAPRERRLVSDPLPSLRSPSFSEQLRKANNR